MTLYGFKSANASDEPAWFHSEAAAARFAAACGWEDAEIETADVCVFTPPEIATGETLRIEGREWVVYS